MDQPRIARAVAAAGAGLVVPRSASPARMRAALTRLLTEPAFAAAADRLGARFRAADGARRAADEIAGLAADAGRPATVARGRASRIPPEDVSRAR
jgi:UDP:flavonoid glycosyltransferase YjiC (YdhE family)